MAWACRRNSTWLPRPAWACRSSGHSWCRSWAAGWRSSRGPAGAPRPWGTCRWTPGRRYQPRRPRYARWARLRRTPPQAEAPGTGQTPGHPLSSRVRARPEPARPPLESAPLVFTHAAPHPGVLAALERPLQAGLNRWASAAYLLGLVDLE